MANTTDGPDLDLLRLTAVGLQQLLQDGQLTSVQLVDKILKQIDAHNEKGLGLKAMLSIAPQHVLLDTADRLDKERADNKLRGPLHGIPIIIKDCFNTRDELGMGTTMGSAAFKSAKAKANAAVVQKLIDSGMIIVGKTNLNEFCSWKGADQWNGWSPVGGQTSSAYVKGGLQRSEGKMGHSNPCGSSTGSAVGVSAGFSPLGLGTETDGSIVQPAARAALFGLKPTPGTTDMSGVWVVSDVFDAVGGMAKSTEDLALLTEMVLNQDARRNLPSSGYKPFLTRSFTGLRVGFLDPKVWRWPEHVQKQDNNSLKYIHDTYTKAIQNIGTHGAQVKQYVDIPLTKDLAYDGEMASWKAIYFHFQQNVEKYMSELDSSEVKTLQDIVEFNKVHADIELPSEHPEQGKLIRALENATTREVYEACMNHCNTIARDGVTKVMEEHGLDLLAMPMDCPIPSIAGCGRFPIATMPLGAVAYNGYERPFGLAIIGQADREDVMFTFMSAFEAHFDQRIVPARLRDDHESGSSATL